MSEFSHAVVVENLANGETLLDLTASPDERAALAARYGVDAVTRLTAAVSLQPLPGGDVQVSADISAEVVQQCVVTLAPVKNSIETSFLTVFSDRPLDEGDGQEIEIDFETPDPADAIIDGLIDAGEAVAEQLALEIDPFPRCEGVEFEPPKSAEFEGKDGEDRPNPFAKLAVLKDKLEQND